MDSFLLIWVLLGVLLIANLAVLFLLLRKSSPAPVDPTPAVQLAVQSMAGDLLTRQSDSFLLLRNSLDQAQQLVDSRLNEGNRTLESRLSLFGEIKNQLGQLSAQATSLEQVSRNMQSLAELLRPPQLRGQLGELFLENLLGQILPPQLFDVQYRFADNSRVDAVVKLGDRLLPIDSKFPLESYVRLMASPNDPAATKEFERVLKQHVNAIHEKYVRTDLGFTPFAIMYIPSEAVYYQFVSRPDQTGLEYAMAKKVIPSSPGHLYAFLASFASAQVQMALFHIGLSAEGQRLVEGLTTVASSAERMAAIQEKSDAALRTLTASLEKSRLELNDIRFQMERLKQLQLSSDKDSSLPAR